MNEFDLTIIGGGVAGLVMASGAAQLGANVALVEKDKLGGDCLHTGCVPSKTLIRSAKIVSLMRRASEFGLKTPDISFDFADVMAHVRAVIAKVGEHDDPKRFENMGVTIKFGSGHFLDGNTFELDGERIHSRKFALATGSRPLIVPIEGLRESGFMTSEGALRLDRLPRSLAILGGGPIGLEFAQIFARFGVDVTVIEKAEHVLPREDKEIADLLQTSLMAEGIEIMTRTEVMRVAREGNLKAILTQTESGEKTVLAEEVLLAVGRVLNTEGLNLEAADVQFTKRGIIVDQTMRTSAYNIWAAGDVVGPYQFTHVAEYQAGLVVSNTLFPFLNRKADYRVVPWATYTDPEVGRVGLTENEARMEREDVRVYRYNFGEHDRAIIDGETSGMIKLVCDAHGGILGAHVLGPHGSDLLHEYVLAMKNGLKVGDISAAIHVYPTFAQAVKRAADQYYRQKLFSGWVPKVAKTLLSFGRHNGAEPVEQDLTRKDERPAVKVAR